MNFFVCASPICHSVRNLFGSRIIVAFFVFLRALKFSIN